MEGGEWAWQWRTKEMVWSVAAIVVSLMVLIIWEKLWLKPRRIRSILEKQGITGPKPSFPMGNLSEIEHIQSQFSSATFMYTTGHRQHLQVGDPKLLKELNRLKTWDLGKPTQLTKHLKPLLGSGIITGNGRYWSFQRNLIAPQFYLSKIQNMVDFMEESTKTMIKKWERIIEENGGEMAEIVIDNDMKELTGDIISKVCFGGSYDIGNQIFSKLTALQNALAKPTVVIGLLFPRILPTKENKEVWRLEKEIKELILKVVHNHKLHNQSSKDQNQKDLLQIILESTADDEEKNNNRRGAWGILKKFKHKRDSQKLIMDICKNIYFAGSDTTAVLLTWTLVQLSLHPQWQHRLRAEILETFPNILPHCFRDMDKLRKMKQQLEDECHVGCHLACHPLFLGLISGGASLPLDDQCHLSMVIQETLRLYGPGIRVSREAFEEVKVGDMVVPKGTYVSVFISAIHREKEMWGEDADEFKPERFERGVSEACKYPQAYLPFGLGNRICVGQKFSITEAKIALTLLLSNFSFSLSPNYRHSPFYNLVLSPKYGAPLLVTKL
ncbi:cytochrome P450 714C2-like [Neltuma alba]|uniref:cytochrome P450 714C2-like n=1 Tax=Neltuma alba TaxID=207710 RepID=UPI0010A572D1|nr:cytochrome P450 714C2-like [Prosopis alba]